MSEKIKIAVDAMGGDGSPKKIIDGIIHNHNSDNSSYYKIFGNKDKIYDYIKDKLDNKFYEIIHTDKIVKSTVITPFVITGHPILKLGITTAVGQSVVQEIYCFLELLRATY